MYKNTPRDALFSTVTGKSLKKLHLLQYFRYILDTFTPFLLKMISKLSLFTSAERNFSLALTENLDSGLVSRQETFLPGVPGRCNGKEAAGIKTRKV